MALRKNRFYPPLDPLGWFWIVVFLVTGSTTKVPAQAPGVVIEDCLSEKDLSALLEKALDLKKTGNLTPGNRLKEQLVNPVPGSIQTPSPYSTPLDPVLLAKRAREIRLWIMVLYICPKCSKWHLRDLVSAYPVAPNAVVTCDHAFNRNLKPEEMPKESYVFVRDAQKRLLGISSVLAANQVMDAVLLRVDPPNLIPVPLNDQLAPGDRVFCYSDPLGQLGYFSDGILNRFYWRPERKGEPGSLEEVSYLRVNFGTDWAPGSSGAPILDQCGNVAGHVSRISALANSEAKQNITTEEEKGSVGRSSISDPPLITVHEGIPARGVMALIRGVNEQAGATSIKVPPVIPRGPDLRPRAEDSPSSKP